MKILLLTTKYSKSVSSPWLTNELAEELRDLGHDITVLCLDWASEADKDTFQINGIRVLNYPAISCNFFPSSLGKAVKWIFSSVVAYRFFKNSLDGRKFDTLISFSPCIPTWFCILNLRNLAAKRVVIYWDFFPIHQAQIGKFRYTFFLKPVFWIERFLISKFDAAGCMSEMNISFFKKYFSLGARVKVFELPIWGRKYLASNETYAATHLKRSQFAYKTLVVFGGQLERGRGVNELLLLAKQLKERNEDIAVVIAGDGPLKSDVIDAVQDGMHNLFYLGRISRAEYLKFIRTCDIGIVATQMNVTVPTYPSKCIDYLLAPLPIIAFVEQSTDFGAILDEAGCGLVCTTGGINELADKVICLAHNDKLRAEMRLACSTFFEQRHDVIQVAQRLASEL